MIFLNSGEFSLKVKCVLVGVIVFVGVLVGVFEGVFVGVIVLVGVFEGVRVGVWVGVMVLVGVFEGVLVGVLVGVWVGVMDTHTLTLLEILPIPGMERGLFVVMEEQTLSLQ